MKTIRDFTRGRPVLAYYILTFAISWGLFLLVGGSDFISGADWESNPQFMAAVMAMLTGPAVAGLGLTAYLLGRAGLAEVLSRLGRWHVSGNWYAVALLTAPLAVVPPLLLLSLVSSDFEPPIISADNKIAVVLPPFAVGFTTLLEELGWTGFAIPRLRRRFSVFSTGLIMGFPWAAWHLLQITWVGRSTSEELPLGIYLLLYLGFAVASLTAFRILMIWVYDRTGSLLVATVMHGSYAACSLQLDFLVPKLTGSNLLTHGWTLSAALWVLVALAALLNRAEFFAEPRVPQAGQEVSAGRPVIAEAM